MLDDLIVIPTNNGYKLLDKLLQSLETTDCNILVVDTGSTDPKHLEYLDNGVWQYGNVMDVVRTPMRGYAQGAYLWAYWNYPAKNYLFLQDSLIAIEDDVLKPFKDKIVRCPEYAIGWASFNFEFDPGAQEIAMKYMYGDHIPQYGIFGPIFYVSRAALDRLNDEGCLPAYPTHSHGAQGLERAWAMVFKRANIHMGFIHNLPNVTLTASGLFGPFRKVFVKRK